MDGLNLGEVYKITISIKKYTCVIRDYIELNFFLIKNNNGTCFHCTMIVHTSSSKHPRNKISSHGVTMVKTIATFQVFHFTPTVIAPKIESFL